MAVWAWGAASGLLLGFGSGYKILFLPSSGTGPLDTDSPLYLPYTTLVSTVGSMVFNEGEAQRLIEILSEKAGIVQDTWHKVGPPSPWPYYEVTAAGQVEDLGATYKLTLPPCQAAEDVPGRTCTSLSRQTLGSLHSNQSCEG